MKAFVNGIFMGYDTVGSGPAVMLIHGFPLNRRMWRPQAQALSLAGYRVITPDLRGFGESDAPDGPYSMELFADDLVALLDHLRIERAVVGGMSMGGYVLLNLLERYPERVTAALFIVTRSGADDEAGKERRLTLAKEVMKFGPQITANVFDRLLFGEATPETQADLVAEVYKWMTENDSRGLAGGLLAMRERKDYTDLLGSFRVPALVIGATEDKAMAADNVRILESGLADSCSCVIPNAGHMVNLEQSAAFNACVLDFLAARCRG